MAESNVKVYIVPDTVNQNHLVQERELYKPRKYRIRKKSKIIRVLSRKRRPRNTRNINEDGKNFGNAWYGLLALSICLMGSSGVASIPLHNIVLYPEVWYDVIIPSAPFTFLLACTVVVRTRIILDCRGQKMKRIFADLFCSATVAMSLLLGVLHLIWTTILGFFEPVPFKCHILAYSALVTLVIRSWYVFPKQLNMDEGSQKRLRAFVYFLSWTYTIPLQLIGVSKVFKETPPSIQWLLGLVLPLIKEINDRITGRLLSKAATTENMMDALLVGKMTTSFQFSFWMTIFLATFATIETGYVMLGINFVINLQLCYKEIKLGRKTFPSHHDDQVNQSLKRGVIMELVLNETIEILVPIAFIVSYTIVFYGPNHDVMGNVGCDYWTFQKVEDLNAFLMPVLLMALVDCTSGLVSGVLLWKYCRINIVMEYCSVIRRYWAILGLLGAAYLFSVQLLFNYFN